MKQQTTVVPAQVALRAHHPSKCYGPTPSHVQILMATRNGAAWIDEQLASLCAQSHDDWSLWCSDDNSSDVTPSKLAQFAGRMWPKRGEVFVKPGPRKGFGPNFISLLAWATPNPSYVAFADQDDLWLPGKLSYAIEALSKVPDGVPAMYFSNRMIWSAEDDLLMAERNAAPRLCFRNALIQNVAPGNTIVLNPAAKTLAQAAVGGASRVTAHDWWLYLLLTGAGGQVIYDPRPSVWYRQHPHNAVGHSTSWKQAAMRKRMVLQNVFADSVRRNIRAMQHSADLLTPQNRALLEQFETCRRMGPLGRIWSVPTLGLFRQNRIGHLGYLGAMALGKV